MGKVSESRRVRFRRRETKDQIGLWPVPVIQQLKGWGRTGVHSRPPGLQSNEASLSKLVRLWLTTSIGRYRLWPVCLPGLCEALNSISSIENTKTSEQKPSKTTDATQDMYLWCGRSQEANECF